MMHRQWTHSLFSLMCLYSASLAVSITTYGDFTENSTLTIACSIEGFDYAASWSNDNNFNLVTCFKSGYCQPFPNNPQISYTANYSGMYVVINPLTSNVKTLWYCLHNGISDSVSFTVLVPPSFAPTIFTTPSGSVISGAKINVTCEVIGGKPLATIYWECVGAFNERNTSTSNKTVSSVQLTVNKTDDGKVCRCKAIHPLWTTNKTVDAVLNVSYAPDTDPIIQQSPPGPIIAGNKVTLTCTVSGGKPLAALSWNCTGTNMNNSSGNTSANSVELTVDKPDNNKVCICSATHPDSSYKPALQHGLIVYYAPDTNPIIQQSPQGPIISGKEVTLTCTVSGGNPLATLSWDCNGTNTNNISGNTASYSVKFIVDKTYDNKVCTCSATHYVSSYRPTTQNGLIVYYAPDTTPIIQQSPPGPIIAGNKVTLTCTVSGGKPLAMLSWNCTGTNTNNSSGNTSAYSVELHVDKTDNNKVCICSATHPDSSYRPGVQHGLIIYYAPDTNPEIQQTPPGPINTGNEVTLTCTVSGGNPLATLSWDCIGNTTNKTSGNTSSYSVVLIVDKTYDNKVCTCSATHYVSSYKPKIQHGLIVYYAPNTAPSINQTPQGPIVSGNKVTLTCTVSGGNPLATLSWDCNGTNAYNISGNTASYSVEFTVDKTYNNRNCSCTATHPVESYRPKMPLGLIVYFAPEVFINRNETIELLEGMDITLTCNATGNPSTYTYHGWTQTFGNTSVRSLNKARDVLTLTDVSYMDIGTYTCFVDNTISDNQNNPIQSASTVISIKFKPIFVDYTKIVSGKIDGNLTASIKLFSYPDIYKPVIWRNASDNSVIGNESNVFPLMLRTHIFTKFYDVLVLLDTFSYESQLRVNSFQLHNQGFYTLQVNNSFSNNNITIRIVISETPHPPKTFLVKTVSSTMVTLFWTAGFNGGNQQNFTITYAIKNTNESKSIIKTEKSDSDEYEVVISDLIPSTAYIFTIMASNIEGSARPENNTLVVVTDSVTETVETPIIGPVAGSLTGVFAATLVVTVIIFYMRKKKEKEKEDHARSLKHSCNSNDEDDLHDNILYESSGPISEEKLNICGIEYASVKKDKTNEHTLRETAFYSDVKKIKRHQLDGKTTGKENVINEEVYENMEHTFPPIVEKRNQDGLLYADLIFNPAPKGAKYIVHGIEDKTIYAEVDTTQKIDPLPESDDENAVERLKSEFTNES